MTSWTHRMPIAAAALALAVVAAAGGWSDGHPAITVGPIRTVAAPGGAPGVIKELIVTVQPAGGGAAERFVVHGPDKLVDVKEEPRAEVIGDRLLVLTDAVIAGFDLASGEQVVDLIGSPKVVATGDGRWVAFKTLQQRFLPKEAISSVIQVLAVDSLAVEPVFPERSVIEPSQFGGLLAWIDDPAERHSAGSLVFSPDGSRLAFFCTHGGLAARGESPPSSRARDDPSDQGGKPQANRVFVEDFPTKSRRIRSARRQAEFHHGLLEEGVPLEVYLVVVELPEDLARSRFVHEPFDWQAYMRREVAAGERQPYFAVESLSWSEERGLVVRTPPYARWLEPEFAVPLPPAVAPTDSAAGGGGGLTIEPEEGRGAGGGGQRRLTVRLAFS